MEKSEGTAVELVDVGGIEVEVDRAFARSWQGLRLFSVMNDPSLDYDGKLPAVIEYYTRAITNIDEVAEAVGGDARKTVEVANAALKADEPKN